MHLVLKTLLNHVERLQGFVYESSRLIEGRLPRIEIQLRARERSRGACSLELTRFGGHLRVPTGGSEYGQVQVKMG